GWVLAVDGNTNESVQVPLVGELGGVDETVIGGDGNLDEIGVDGFGDEGPVFFRVEVEEVESSRRGGAITVEFAAEDHLILVPEGADGAGPTDVELHRRADHLFAIAVRPMPMQLVFAALVELADDDRIRNHLRRLGVGDYQPFPGAAGRAVE